MKKGDATCSGCGAGFRRLELAIGPSTKGEYRCPACGEVVEKFDGSAFTASPSSLPPRPSPVVDGNDSFT